MMLKLNGCINKSEEKMNKPLSYNHLYNAPYHHKPKLIPIYTKCRFLILIPHKIQSAGMSIPSTGSSPSSRRNSFRNDSFIDEKDVIEAITNTEMGYLSIIVLGASGDLAKKKTFPALFNLFRQVQPL
jgi:Glucose-6-phosphate dehydrogenase, NAD binding domain